MRNDHPIGSDDLDARPSRIFSGNIEEAINTGVELDTYTMGSRPVKFYLANKDTARVQNAIREIRIVDAAHRGDLASQMLLETWDTFMDLKDNKATQAILDAAAATLTQIMHALFPPDRKHVVTVNDFLNATGQVLKALTEPLTDRLKGKMADGIISAQIMHAIDDKGRMNTAEYHIVKGHVDALAGALASSIYAKETGVSVPGVKLIAEQAGISLGKTIASELNIAQLKSKDAAPTLLANVSNRVLGPAGYTIDHVPEKASEAVMKAKIAEQMRAQEKAAEQQKAMQNKVTTTSYDEISKR